MSEIDGRKPLRNPRHESYARARASGADQTSAMVGAFPSRASWGRDAKKSGATKIESRPEIQARIAHLKSEAAMRSTVTRASVIDVMGEVFASMGERAKAEGRTDGAAVSAVSQIGRVLLDNLPEPAEEGAGPYVRDYAEMVADPYMQCHREVLRGEGCDLWIKGGRASAKSSYVSVELVGLLMRDPGLSALVMTKRQADLRDSVYEQVLWALRAHGVEGEWECTVSPLRMVRRATGQQVTFRGCDKAAKSKGLKAPAGTYYGVLWVEEADQFSGMSELRTVYQSVTRGAPEGSPFYRFHTYNPPRSLDSWANLEAERRQAAGMRVVSTTYLQLPPGWLPEQTLADAEALRLADEESYRHEYLGEPVGFGAEVFQRVEVREVPDSERAGLERRLWGVDWGFSQDPWVMVEVAYDKRSRTLYVLSEDSGLGLGDMESAARAREMLEAAGDPGARVMCDCADPKAVATWRNEGVHADGAPKSGPHGIKQSVRWLQGRSKIVVDPRCRIASSEFRHYAYALDPEGRPTGELPDADNHAIDAVRYACATLIADRRCV